LLLDELEGIIQFLQLLYPDRNIERQNIPLEPTLGTFVVRFLSDGKEVETAARTVTSRGWDIVYFAHDTQDALRVMDEFTAKVADARLMIPLPNSLSFLRSEGISFSKPFTNENDQDVIIGVLYTKTRTAISQAHYEKVLKASVVIK